MFPGMKFWILLGLGILTSHLTASAALIPLTIEKPPSADSASALDFQVLLDPEQTKAVMKILDSRSYGAEGKYLAWSEAAKDQEDSTKDLESQLDIELRIPVDSLDLPEVRQKLERLRLGKASLLQAQLAMQSASMFLQTIHQLQLILEDAVHGKFVSFSEIRGFMKTLWRLSMDIWKTEKERRDWEEVCLKIKSIRNLNTDEKMGFTSICFN